MTLLVIEKPTDFFVEKVKTIRCQDSTKAYISKVFSTLRITDFSNDSLTLIYYRARENYNFEKFQQLGDWILFANTLYPESLSDASEEYYYALGQEAYYRCYKILNKQWDLFEELADRLPQLVSGLRTNFQSF